MLNDLKQPAQDWLADAMENLSGLLGDGEDPSFTLDVFGAEIEIRLNNLPGHSGQGPVDVPHRRHVQTMRELLACFLAWEPQVRVIGNVRAGDAAAAITYILKDLGLEALLLMASVVEMTEPSNDL